MSLSLYEFSEDLKLYGGVLKVSSCEVYFYPSTQSKIEDKINSSIAIIEKVTHFVIDFISKTKFIHEFLHMGYKMTNPLGYNINKIEKECKTLDDVYRELERLDALLCQQNIKG